MNHRIVTRADGVEGDLVTDDNGREVGIFFNDGEFFLFWHPEQSSPIKREDWKTNY